MITYKKGSIFTSKCEVLACPVNCVGVMGAGLAKQFKDKFPEFEKQYKRLCLHNMIKIGRLQISPFSITPDRENRGGVYFPTKKHWKDSSKLEYIESGLETFVQMIGLGLDDDYEGFAFPKLGCGLGGLDWELQVKPLMEKYLGDLEIKVEIYI